MSKPTDLVQGTLDQPARHDIRVGRVSPPQITLEHRHELRRDKTHLARELSHLLADEPQVVGNGQQSEVVREDPSG